MDLPVSSVDLTGLTSCANELRVADLNKVEIPSQVYGEQVDIGGVRTCHLLFQATVGASTSQTYYVYYGNPTATAPSYTTDLSVTSAGTLRTIQNAFFNLDLDLTYGVISRVRLPQGSNTNLPLAISSDHYWGWHQVCASAYGGNITGKNSQCEGGQADATGLTFQETLAGPLVSEYTLTSVKFEPNNPVATYTIKFRFFAHAPYYQYSVVVSNTPSGVMNNFWYTVGTFSRLGTGLGGTPTTAYNTYDFNNDHVRIATFDQTVEFGSVPGTDNDGTDLGGPNYYHSTGPPHKQSLILSVVTGASQTAAEGVLARINTPLSLSALGAAEDGPIGQYGSPIELTPSSGWVTTNFNWQNPAINSQNVQWRIKYYDLSGNFYYTPAMTFAVGSPTAVVISSFRAKPILNGIQLDWQTANEVNLLGFNLYRADAPDGQRSRLNQSLIPAKTPGGLNGNSYRYQDGAVISGKTYYYWIEVVMRDGTQVYEPVSVIAPYWNQLWLPVISR